MTTLTPTVLIACLATTAACASSPKIQLDTTEPPSGASDHDTNVTPAPGGLTEGINAFATDLYAEIGNAAGNLAFSPASISMAMAMTYAGARGRTAEQMRNVMHFGTGTALHDDYGTTLASWNDPTRSSVKLRVVNRLFGDQGTTFESPFLSLTKDRYAAPLEQLDFVNKPDEGRRHINDWVEQQTNDRIKELLPQGSITSDSRLVLTNAVYFKGKWKAEFDKENTRDEVFHRDGSPDISVPTMHLSTNARHAVVDGAQILELPYAGDRLAMNIILPTQPGGLKAIEQSMTAETLDRWVSALAPTDVDVALPRFKIDPAEATPLSTTLRAMGMILPFTADADFSAMSQTTKLAIDEVFHKAFVEVNEEGTEAAAATAVVMREESAPMEPEAVAFTADQPFVFAIRDVESGAMLFMGRVADPSA